MKPNRRLIAQPEQLAEWLAAIAAGDRRAFQLLYRATAPKLFALLLRILKRRDIAEDALQDAYVKIWERAGSYTPERGAPLAWLLTVARYGALDMLRRQRPENEYADESDRAMAQVADRESAQPEREQETRQALDAVHAGLAELPPEQRECLLQAYLEGATREELAKNMDVPVGTVKTWLRRGLIRLREHLSERFP